ncbi:MAG: TIGR03643 family protein [Fulvivirga sp.]|nr:TIGR03643 family protein [Fulvivirga sp.]
MKSLSDRAIDRIVEMAWEDRTPFDAIYDQFGMTESDVIKLMRRELKHSSFIMWRKRVQGRKTKHKHYGKVKSSRFKSSRQQNISMNKIPKR